MIATVKGEFQKFNASIEAVGENFDRARVQATLDASSIFTNEENRDKHLRSADFFEVEKFPTIRFKSTKIAATGSDQYDVTGNLTIRDVTREVTIPVTFLGFAKDPWGKERAGFELETKLNRKDYGLNWNKALDQGGFLLADDVKISIAIEAVKQ